MKILFTPYMNTSIHSNINLIISELKNNEILKHFTKEELEISNNEVKEIKYEKGQEIIHEGSKPLGIYGILKGTAKLYKTGYNGREQILRFLKEGDIIGYRSLLGGESFRASCTTLTRLTALYIPEVIFNRLLEYSPKVSFDILKKISLDLGEAGQTITLLAQKTMRERLAEILLFLEDRLGKNEEGFIKISLTREELANLVGTATESTIRLISEFKSDGLIKVEGRKIKILSHSGLTHIAKLDL